MFTLQGLQSGLKRSPVAKAQLNEVRSLQWFSLVDMFSNIRSFSNMLLESSLAFKVVDGSATPSKSEEVPAAEAKDAKSPNKPSPAALASEESISEFIAQVASLVK